MSLLKAKTMGTVFLLGIFIFSINLSAQETPPVAVDTVRMLPETTKVDTTKMEPAPIVPPTPVETTKVAPPMTDTAKKAIDTAQVKLDTIPTAKESRMILPTDTSVTAEPAYFMKEVTFTPFRSEKSNFRVPNFVYMINQDKKAKQNPNIMMDLLKNAAGVEAIETGQFNTHPVIRGLFGSRVLLLVDGVRMNTYRDFPWLNSSPTLVDVDQVKKIEIINGSASHLYGSDALGGVINFLTARPEFLKPQEMEMEEGYDISASYKFNYSSIGEQKKNRLEVNLADSKWALVLGGSFRKVPQNYKSGGDNEQIIPNSRIEEESGLDLKLAYKLQENQTLYLQGSRNRDFEVGFANQNSLSFPFQKRDKASLEYEIQDLTERIPWVNIKGFFQEQRRLFQIDLPADTLNQIDSDVKLWGASLQGVYLVPPHQSFSLGLDYGLERIKGGNTIFWDQPKAILEDTTRSLPEIHWDMAGVYVLDEIIIVPKLSAFLGGRYDYNQIKHFDSTHFKTPPEERFDRYNSFQGGVVYRFQKGFNLNGNISRGFRIPTVVERYYFGPLDDKNWLSPNERLNKERNVNLNLGAKANLDDFSGSVCWFYADLRNFIDLKPVPGAFYNGKQVWTWKNLAGTTRMVGLEGALEVSFTDEFYGFSNWSWIWGQHRRDTTDQRIDTAAAFEVVFVPPFKVYFGIGWKDKENRFWAEASTRMVAQQERIPLDSTGQKILPNTSGFAVYNLRGGINLAHKHSLTVAINNVTNRFYVEPYNQFTAGANNTVQIPEPGRNFAISLTLRY